MSELQKLLVASGVLDAGKEVSYDKLVDPTFARAAQ